MHDKAFEKGHFMIDDRFRIRTNARMVGSSTWAQARILECLGAKIRTGPNDPRHEGLSEHQPRIRSAPTIPGD